MALQGIQLSRGGEKEELLFNGYKITAPHPHDE